MGLQTLRLKRNRRQKKIAYWERAAIARLLPLPRAGRRVGLAPRIRGTGWPR